MIDATTIVLSVLAFGPAFALMLYTLQDYAYPKVEKPFFDDRKVFGLFVLGLVIGMIFFFVDVSISISVNPATILLIALAIPLLQGFIKLAILNWPKFQRKVDTAFYGLSFGLGIAATYAFSKMYFIAQNPELIGMESLDLQTTLMLGMMGVQIIFIQGATTAMIGVGCARGQPYSYFANAMMYAIGYSLLLNGFAIAIDYAGDITGIIVLLVAWVICLYSYWHVHKIDLPVLIDDAKRGFKRR